MAGAALFSHPIWFLCSLVQFVILWARRQRGWSPQSCPVDLTGKTALVTGGSSGIGKAVALDLARRNARTILVCRNKDTGQAAVEEIRRKTGNASVHLRLLDISCMASVRSFASRFLKEEGHLHILVNNAGITGLPHALTPEGLQVTYATNFLGPFLLTNLLLDALNAPTAARIVNVSSFRHYEGEVNLQSLKGAEESVAKAYDSTKLLNVVFTIELARRLQGTGVTVNAVSPGVVRTSIMRYSTFFWRLLFALCAIFMKSPKEGAISTLFCAVSEEAEGISGKYFDSSCHLAQPLVLAQDAAVGRKLWEASEVLTGLKTEAGNRKQTHVSSPAV